MRKRSSIQAYTGSERGARSAHESVTVMVARWAPGVDRVGGASRRDRPSAPSETGNAGLSDTAFVMVAVVRYPPRRIIAVAGGVSGGRRPNEKADGSRQTAARASPCIHNVRLGVLGSFDRTDTALRCCPCRPRRAKWTSSMVSAPGAITREAGSARVQPHEVWIDLRCRSAVPVLRRTNRLVTVSAASRQPKS